MPSSRLPATATPRIWPLLGLATVFWGALRWWQLARLAPAVDAQTADRLRG